MRLSVHLLLLALLPSTSWAQESGGSFGGSDFGGSSDIGSSSSDTGSSSSGSDWSSGSSGVDYGGSGGGPGGGSMPPLAAIALITIVCGVIALVIYKTQQRHKRRRRGPYQVPRSFVARLQLAFDWRERAAVQGVLDRLAAAAADDLKSRAGLDRVLDLTLMSLEKRSDAIRLADWLMESLEGLPACEERFRALAAAERSRYQVEVVRGEAGGATREDAAFVAHPEEGRGFVVVTILVASRKKPPPAELHLDRTGLATAFRELIANTGKTILALEVVWTPAAEQDRMSSAEMQVLFPDLRAVDTLASAAGLPELGRVTCSYCTAVFAAELGECPQCGAGVKR